MSGKLDGVEPVIIIPDTAPLIHLAAGGVLEVLTAFGHVVVPDMVQFEAVRLPEKPWAREICDWLKSAPVAVVETDIGALYRFAVERGMKPPRNAGELSIIEWLRDELGAGTASRLVVYEDLRFARMMAQEDFGPETIAVTTRTFLEAAEDRHLIRSADDVWAIIVANAPTANPVSRRHREG